MSDQGVSNDAVQGDEDDAKKERSPSLSYAPCNLAMRGDEKPCAKYPGRGTSEDPFIVDWDQNDPENPFNWPKRRKWLITMQVCLPEQITQAARL